MIKQIYLFTNRNSIFFDEKGEQIIDCQAAVGWSPLPSYKDSDVHAVIRRIMEDKPTIYIARWQEWAHEITLHEFTSLIGFGPWYWKEKSVIQEDIEFPPSPI